MQVRVDWASSVIDLTHETNSEANEVVEIPGFPVEWPRTLVPLEEEDPTPGEVWILSYSHLTYH